MFALNLYNGSLFIFFETPRFEVCTIKKDEEEKKCKLEKKVEESA